MQGFAAHFSLLHPPASTEASMEFASQMVGCAATPGQLVGLQTLGRECWGQQLRVTGCARSLAAVLQWCIEGVIGCAATAPGQLVGLFGLADSVEASSLGSAGCP